MLTNEQIVVMTKEQLLSVDFKELWPSFQDMEYTKFKDDKIRIVALFEGQVSEWAAAFRKAFDTKEVSDELYLTFAKEPALIKLMVWSRLTSGGIDEIEFAKFIHHHIADIIIVDVFGCTR